MCIPGSVHIFRESHMFHTWNFSKFQFHQIPVSCTFIMILFHIQDFLKRIFPTEIKNEYPKFSITIRQVECWHTFQYKLMVNIILSNPLDSFPKVTSVKLYSWARHSHSPSLHWFSPTNYKITRETSLDTSWNRESLQTDTIFFQFMVDWPHSKCVLNHLHQFASV